jgi:dienelactone hydrolase
LHLPRRRTPQQELSQILDQSIRGRDDQRGADCEVISYSGIKHSFTSPDAASAGMPAALAYNKQTDQRSWNAIVNFFKEVFA